MKQIRLTKLCLPFVIIIMALLANSGCEKKGPPPKFQLFTDYEFGFYMEFPCAPKKTGRREVTGAGPLRVAEFSCKAGTATYSALVTEPMRTITRPAADTRGFVFSRIESSGRVMKKTKTEMAGLAAVRLQVKRRKAVAEHRVLDVAGRVYELRVSGRGMAALDSDTARRFFDSFRHFSGEKLGKKAEKEKPLELDPGKYNKGVDKERKKGITPPLQPVSPDMFFMYENKMLEFTVKLPQGFDETKTEKRAANTAGGAPAPADLVIAGNGDLLFTIIVIKNYFDTGADVPVETFVKNLGDGARVYRTEKRTVDGREAFFAHYSIDQEGKRVYGNMIVARIGNSMYQIHEATPDARTLVSPEAEIFLESFHYTGETP